ncbi:MAG: hypothetical protein KIH01_00890 [Candidatus Freyarchaeota archaeon]|nr:hypothetical protein [Candidatus Jordarchaeia archaeon]
MAAIRRQPIQASLPVDEIAAMGGSREKQVKILHAVKEGAYKVTFTFNGLPYQPREIRLFLEEAEKKLNLLREGVTASQGGIHFNTIVLDRQTLQHLYILLLKYEAQVKIEKTSHFSSRKLGRMVWRAVHAPS